MANCFTDKIIKVCSKCGRACCWHGEFMCDDAGNAGTMEKTVSELRVLKCGENEFYWSDEYMSKVCGIPAPYGYRNHDKTLEKK